MAFCGRAARDEERSAADGVRAERDALRSECEARWAHALCLGLVVRGAAHSLLVMRATRTVRESCKMSRSQRCGAGRARSQNTALGLCLLVSYSR